MQFSGQLNKEILVRAGRLHRGNKRLFVFIGVICTVFLIGYFKPVVVTVFFFGCLVLIPGLALAKFLTARHTKKRLGSSALLSQNIEFEVNESEIQQSTANTTSVFKWEMFKRAKNGKGILLLYLSPLEFLIIPREFFRSEGDWVNLLSMAREKLGTQFYG